MEDFKINDYILEQEAKQLVKDAIEETDGSDEEVEQWIWETVGGHQWVIYYYHAKQLCSNCDVSEGEQWLLDTGLDKFEGYDKMCTQLAFATLYTACQEALASKESA